MIVDFGQKEPQSTRLKREEFRAKETKKDRCARKIHEFIHFFTRPIERIVNLNIYDMWREKLKYKNAVKQLNGSKQMHAKKKAALEEVVQKYEANLERAVSAKKSFAAVGGKGVKITAADGTHIDGMYTSAKRFLEKAKAAGIQRYSFSYEDEKGNVICLKGLIFDSESLQSNEFIENLENLKVFENKKGKKPHFVKVHLKSTSQVLLLELSKVQSCIDNAVIKQKGNDKYVLLETDDLKISSLRTSKVKGAGTVILGRGAGSTFEMAKREQMAFLLMGVNVLAYNSRGIGKSKGKPTSYGMRLDAEAAYQYVRRGQKKDKILARGLCLSGDPMAFIARKHPGVHLMLDQTYATFHDAAYKNVSAEAKKILGISRKNREKRALRILHHGLKPFMHLGVAIFAPKLNVERQLKHVRGNVFLIHSSEDTAIPLKQMARNINQLAKAKRLHQVKAIEIPGKHGAFWGDACVQASAEGDAENKTFYLGRASMAYFLKAADLSRPLC